jgi:hypothetical protein
VRRAAPAASSPAVQGPATTRAGCPPLPKSRATVYARTLHRACEVLGSLDALSRHLGVPTATIASWIGGVEEPPIDRFLAAVDIVLLGAEPGGNYKT